MLVKLAYLLAGIWLGEVLTLGLIALLWSWKRKDGSDEVQVIVISQDAV